MTTMIVIYNSDGLVGRCDKRCYDGTTKNCECVCGGKNHGVGLRQAAANTIIDAAQWLERQAGTDPTTRELSAKTARDLRTMANQMHLFAVLNNNEPPPESAN